jgi:hypothetical protein
MAAANALTRGFIDAISAGRSFDDAKRAAFERATSEMERMIEMYEETLENEDKIRAGFRVNPNSRFAGSADRLISMYRDAITVSAMVLALLKNSEE